MLSQILFLCMCIVFSIALPRKNDTGYIFESPRTLKSNGINELSFHKFGPLEKCTLTVQVFYKKDYDSVNETVAAKKVYTINEDDDDAIILDLPLNIIDENANSGRIQINGSCNNYKFSGSDTVGFSVVNKDITIIQTDKPFYQPGQTVFFRILNVNKTLKPETKYYKADVYVENPTGIRLFQFLNINLKSGLVQNQFPLIDEPAFGTWSIKLNLKGSTQTDVVSTFEVKEYVLPKFDVNIEFPSFVLATTKIIPVEICAEYTYGKPVIGTLNLNASLEQYYYIYDSSSSFNQNPVLQETLPIKGCVTYKINVTEIEPNGYSYRRIQVTANVVEDGTGVQRNNTQYLQRTTNPLNVQFVEGPSYYKPNLPYNGKLKVTNPDNTPAKKEKIEICATINKQRILAGWSATKTLQTCKNYTSDYEGIIPFIIAPQNVDVSSISLQAKSIKYQQKSNSNNILTQPQTSTYLNSFYSPSGSFIQLQPVPQPISCGSTITLNLLFNSDKNAEIVFHYKVTRQSAVVLDDSIEENFKTDDDVSELYTNNDEVIDGPLKQTAPLLKARSSNSTDNCPAAKESQYTSPVGSVEFDIDVTSSLSPTFQVLIFYVRNDGEVVADSATYSVQKCLPNKVDFAFLDKIQQPGLDTEIQITSAPNSLCGIKAIDKSVDLLDNSDQLTLDTVFQQISGMDNNQYYSSNPCYGNTKQPGLKSNRQLPTILPPGTLSSSNADSYTAFQTAGFLVISDLFILTRECIDSPRAQPIGLVRTMGGFASTALLRKAGPVALATGGASATNSVSAVRDYFPETWLFELYMTGPDGILTMTKKLPDSITQWIGSAVCVDSSVGLGISNTTNITAFQAFFIDYTLPVSVVRGEQVEIIISISNYADGALPISVTLENPEGFEVVGKSLDTTLCVEQNTVETLPLFIEATKVGEVNITVHAETANSSNVCGDIPVSNSYARDAIRKPIQVEAEGFPQDYVINTLFCPSDDDDNVFQTTVNITLPESYVADSERAYADFTGNLLGPAINNLDTLIQLPTGCGEQNMALAYSNYVVLDYLQSIGELTDNIKSKAIYNMKTGYQRELNFRHDDGSFSAFGTTDKTGSMWLTAFVLQGFSKMQKYIYIDGSVLDQMVKWIISKQAPDGCFPNIGQVIDIDLEGGLKNENTSGSITAFVLSSLLKSNVTNETAINLALKCLDENDPPNTYVELLYAYAQALAGEDDDAQQNLDEAKQRINITGGMEFFKIINASEATLEEADGYAIMTTLLLDGNAQDVLPYVLFLTTHLNPSGGFSNSQATYVGLEALSQFARIVYKDKLNLKVKTTGGLKTNVAINKDNQLLVQRFKVTSVPTTVNIVATGSGCGLMQTLVKYNTILPPEAMLFSLEVSGDCLSEDCDEASIQVITSYLPAGQIAGMSIVEVKLITGFSVDKNSLNDAQSNPKNNIMKVEVKDNMVIFYLSEISNTPQTFSFIAIKVVEVKNPQPGTAEVYDYYANENSASTSYTIKGY